MTRHPGIDHLRTFAAGEQGRARDRVSAHLESCGECRGTIVVMREVIAAARDDFAPPVPAGAFDRIKQRRVAGERVILPVSEPSRPRRSLSRALPWAAGLIVAAGVAAAAMPGSPLRAWIADRFTERKPPQSERREPRAEIAPPTVVAEDTTVSAVLIPLGAGDLWVAARAQTQPFRIRLRITDASELEVRGVGGAAAAVFRPREDGVAVSNGAGGEIQVDVPRALRRFELRVGDRRYVVKEGERLRALAPADTLAGALIVQVKP